MWSLCSLHTIASSKLIYMIHTAIVRDLTIIIYILYIAHTHCVTHCVHIIFKCFEISLELYLPFQNSVFLFKMNCIFLFKLTLFSFSMEKELFRLVVLPVLIYVGLRVFN